MKAVIIQHVPFEDAAGLVPVMESLDISSSSIHLYRGETLPSVSSFDFLLVMGGPMNIYQYDEYPWLKEEKNFIRQAIDSGKKVMGICLGAQLIADSLGAQVVRNNQKEIGWFPVYKKKEAGSLLLPDEFYAFHWHGDTFQVPEGAVHLAESSACLNQAFQYKNNVLALQFHLESTEESIRALIENCRGELEEESEWIQNEKEIIDLSKEYFPGSSRLLIKIMSSFINNSSI